MDQATLRIRRAHLDEIARHALAARPQECCGILTGAREPDHLSVTRIIMAGNVADFDRSRTYQVDWQALLGTVQEVRTSPDGIVGFYHSHPNGSAAPSALDLDHAWRDHAYLILALDGDTVADTAAWYLPPEATAFSPLPLVVA